MSRVPLVTMADGVAIPQLGFGTWQVEPKEAQEAVAKALEVGYRHIDTAAAYENEEGVGRALSDGGIARDELFVTTKVWNDHHEPADARKSVEESLAKLGLDHLDLLLIHWPAHVKYGDSYIRTWDAFQEFKAEGLTRSIGVSNFNPDHLDRLNGEVPPINQVECHPTFQNVELDAELARRGILLEAWSPLGSGEDLENPVLCRISEQIGKSVAQVIIRWHLQKNHVVLPKSVTPKRIEENFDVFDFELSDEQMADIATVEAGNRTGGDPAEGDF